jgi:hypothetical protein
MLLRAAGIQFIERRGTGGTSMTARFGRRSVWPGLALGLAVLASSAQTAAPDPFAPVAPLLGRWEGTAEGRPGAGTVRREYSRTLRNRFIRVQNRSEYPAQEKNPKGEIHEDEGYISFDRGRKALVLRQFHVEGFVNQFIRDATAPADRVVFTSEAIENLPAGWRARETYVLASPDAFEEIFELAEPGGAFEVYSRSRFKRAK